MSKSEKHFDIAVIGGGAAGLFCSVLIKSRKPELSVAVIEAQDRVGKKLLTTGNGRCNLTNLYITPDMYHGSFKKGAEHLLELCPPTTVVGLFEELGLLTYAEDDGRVYPVSKQANSVLDILRLAMDKLGLHVCNETVRKAVIKLGYSYKKKSLHASEQERPRCQGKTQKLETAYVGESPEIKDVVKE